MNKVLRKLFDKETRKDGFTIVELVVATAIVSLVLVAVTAGVTFSIRNSRFSQEKSLSVRYAQEGIEWMRYHRDILGWGNFNATLNQRFGSGNSFILCLNNIELETEPTQDLSINHGGECEENPIEGKYVRILEVNRQSDNVIELVSRVSWDNSGEPERTIIQTSLYRWR